MILYWHKITSIYFLVLLGATMHVTREQSHPPSPNFFFFSFFSLKVLNNFITNYCNKLLQLAATICSCSIILQPVRVTLSICGACTDNIRNTKLQSKRAYFVLCLLGFVPLMVESLSNGWLQQFRVFSSALPVVLQELSQTLMFIGLKLNCLLIWHTCSKNFSWICGSGLALILRICIMNCHKERLALSTLHSCTLHQPNNKTVPVAWYLCAEWCLPANYSEWCGQKWLLQLVFSRAVSLKEKNTIPHICIDNIFSKSN